MYLPLHHNHKLTDAFSIAGKTLELLVLSLNNGCDYTRRWQSVVDSNTGASNIRHSQSAAAVVTMGDGNTDEDNIWRSSSTVPHLSGSPEETITRTKEYSFIMAHSSRDPSRSTENRRMDICEEWRKMNERVAGLKDDCQSDSRDVEDCDVWCGQAKTQLEKVPHSIKYNIQCTVCQSDKPFLALRDSSLEHTSLSQPGMISPSAQNLTANSRPEDHRSTKSWIILSPSCDKIKRWADNERQNPQDNRTNYNVR